MFLHENSISFTNHNQTWLLINQKNEIEIKFSNFMFMILMNVLYA